jgi:hypothetical protein
VTPTATSTPVNLQTLTLAPDPITPGVGKAVTVTITIGDVAPGDGLLVSLSGIDPKIATAPSSVTIPAGSNIASFNVTGVAVGNTSVTATATGHTQGSATINVRQNQILLPPSVLVAPGASVQFPVTLSDPAPTGGLTVSLSTFNSSTGTVTSQVVIPEGQKSSTATATGIATDKNNNITAAAPNFTGTSTVLQVETITASFGNPNSTATNFVIPMNATWVTRTVVLSDSAPPGGITVNLAFDSSIASTTPTSVVVPAGQLASAPFTINGLQQSSTTTRLTASATGISSGAQQFTVGPPPAISGLNGTTPLTVASGMEQTNVFVQLNTAAPPGGLVVNFVSSSTGQVPLPAPITIQAGVSSGNFTVKGSQLTATAPASVTASASTGSLAWQPTSLNVTVVKPVMRLFDSSNGTLLATRTVGAAVENIGTQFCVSVGNCPDVLSAPQTVTFSISSDTTGGETVIPASVTVPAGDLQTNQVQQVQLSSPIGAGSYTVNATSNGFATDPPSVTTTVVGPKILSVNGGSALTVATGMQANTVGVGLDTPAPTGGLKVILTATTGDAQVLSSCPDGTPSCTLVTAGQQSASFVLGGVNVTSPSAPVTLTASATSNGVVWQSASVQVTVVKPVMRLFDSSNGTLLATRTVGAAVENIGAQFCVSVGSCPDVLSAAQTVTFSISSDTTGGETVTPASVTVPAGDLQTNQVQQVQLSSPIGAGSYTVNATSNGFATDPPPVTTTVIGPKILFVNGGSALTVATGMQTNFVGVSLDTPAPTGGLKVILTTTTGEAQVLSSCPDGTPSCMLVTAGQQSANFALGGVSVTSPSAPVTLTASATSNGVVWQSASVQVTVVKPVMRLFDSSNGTLLATRTVGAAVENIGAQFCVSVGNCPDVLSAAQTVTFSISGDTTGGETVTPASVTVPAGDLQTNQVQQVQLSSPIGAGSYTVNATSNGFATDPPSVTTTVVQPAITFLNGGSAVTVATGMQTNTVSISLDTPAPANGLTVNLASTDGTVATVDPTAVIAQGQQSGVFTLKGTNPGTTQITASAPGWKSPANLNVTVANPVLFLFDPSNGVVLTTRTIGAVPENVGARFCLAQGNCPDVLSTAQTVTFSISNDTTGGVTVAPLTVTVPAGDLQSTQVQSVVVSSPTSTGAYTLNATATGPAGDAAPVTTTVNRPSITSLNGTSALTVGTGMQRNSVSISLDTPAPQGGLKVTFSSTGGQAQVLSSCPDGTPSCTLITAGQFSGNFNVGGISVTSPGQPVTISAAATSNGVVWQTATATLQVTVIKPGLFLFDPSNGTVLTTRTVGAAVENIGARFCQTQNNCPDLLSTAQTVTFSISSDTTGGETVSPTTVTVPSGDVQTTQVQQVQLSSPKQAGSYTVNATDTGFVPDAPSVTTTVH